MRRLRKDKIEEYLASKATLSAYDLLLRDWLDGSIRARLEEMGLSHVTTDVDWGRYMSFISINGRCGSFYVSIDVFPGEYSFAADLVSPDEDDFERLTEHDAFYANIAKRLKGLGS